MTGTVPTLSPDILIIGAGPAGLTAARTLARRGDRQVLVLEREQVAGGIPRHSDHHGYGIRDLHRSMRGPAYADRLVEDATASGATIRTGSTVTGWVAPHSVEVTSPEGRLRVEARAIVLATGARERPRPARMIPGDRPPGVYTTGQLQSLVHLYHRPVGSRAVVVGAELVSWSAVLTLRHAGCATVLMTTRFPSPESYGVFNLAGRSLLRTRVATRTRVTRVIGRSHLRAVEVEHLDTGRRQIVECDTLVLTGDWIPDHELARSAGLDLDPRTRGPLVDTALRTSRPGVFAVGNLVHPVDTADVAAFDGLHVADQVIAWLGGHHVVDHSVRIAAEPPLTWVSPGLIRAGDPAPARHRLLVWTDRHVRIPRVRISQGERVVGRRTLPWPASPGRVFRVPWRLLEGIDPGGGPASIWVE